MRIIAKIKKEAERSGYKKVIVFPEGEEPRTQKAVQIIAKKGYALPILLGDEKQIKRIVHSTKIRIINPKKEKERKERYARQLLGLLKKPTRDCLKLLEDPIYFGLMLVKNKEADGLIAGAIHSTAHLLRAAFKIIGSYHRVAGVCILEAGKKIYFFADCGVTIDPTENELADIAINTARLARALGVKPKVAVLSFSTHGSAQHEKVDKIRKAVGLAKRKDKNLIIDGEIQLDAAIAPEVMKIKCPKSKLKGEANVLIFPDLNAGNIGYKIAERFGNNKAVGPILVGMKAPVNDLSRGCKAEDIINLALITAFQARKTR